MELKSLIKKSLNQSKQEYHTDVMMFFVFCLICGLILFSASVNLLEFMSSDENLRLSLSMSQFTVFLYLLRDLFTVRKYLKKSKKVYQIFQIELQMIEEGKIKEEIEEFRKLEENDTLNQIKIVSQISDKAIRELERIESEDNEES